MRKIAIRTTARVHFKDITNEVQEIVAVSGVGEGVCYVFVPHTTAGVTLNEHADPDVARDIADLLDRVAPHLDSYRHSEGNAAAHMKASLVGCSVTIPLEEGKLQLGTWQGIFFCEFDGPRTRSVLVQILKG